MTLAPLVISDIRGVKGKPAELSQWCVAPGCLSLTQQRHHLWPKSYLRGQPYEWVEINGKVIPNSVGLCVRHHGWVTSPIGGHKAKITYDPGTGLFHWWELFVNEMRDMGPLREQALVAPEPEVRHIRRSEGLCPTCGRVAPKEKKQTSDGLPKRPTKTWSLLVPTDEEGGAEILDVYVEDLAVFMGLDPESPRLLRYHVLVPALEWVNQNKAAFIADWENEESEAAAT